MSSSFDKFVNVSTSAFKDWKMLDAFIVPGKYNFPQPMRREYKSFPMLGLRWPLETGRLGWPLGKTETGVAIRDWGGH